MPTEQEHYERYRDNQLVLAGTPPLRTTSPAWAVTVAFYSAVHLVELLAAAEGIHHAKHVGPASRKEYLARHPAHRVLSAPLGHLLSASHVARYESCGTFAAGYTEAVIANLFDIQLASIRQHVERHTGRMV